MKMILSNGHATEQSCDVTVSSDRLFWVDTQARGIQNILNNQLAEQVVIESNRMMLNADSVQYVNTSEEGIFEIEMRIE